MDSKVVTYALIVAMVMLYMFFRAEIYYTIHETDGFYIDIGHEAKDTVKDIATDEEDLFIISTTRVKTGGQNYHAFTRLSRDIKVKKEVNLDTLFEDKQMPEIETLLDILVLEDVYILYHSTKDLEDDVYVVVRMSKDGEVLSDYQSIGVVNTALLVYEGEIILFKLDGTLLSFVAIDANLLYVREEYLYTVKQFSYTDAVVMNDQLYMLFETDGQYAVHLYDFVTKETTIHSVDPKIKKMVVGDVLYLLEYRGDYLTSLYRQDALGNFIEEIIVDPYTYYDVLYVNDRLLFYGSVVVAEQLKAVYGYYEGNVIGTTTLDIPYNNSFIKMIPFHGDVIGVIRTNYLMDYQIRKTIYTKDDILYTVD